MSSTIPYNVFRIKSDGSRVTSDVCILPFFVSVYFIGIKLTTVSKLQLKTDNNLLAFSSFQNRRRANVGMGVKVENVQRDEMDTYV